MTDPQSPDVVDEFFATDDIDEAEKIVRRVYPRAELHETRNQFSLEQTTRGSSELSFTRFQFASEMDIEVDFENVAALGLVLAGNYTAHTLNERLDTTKPFLFRPGRGGSHSDGLDLLMVNISLPALERAAAEHTGSPRASIHINDTAPVSGAMAAHWRRTLGYAWRSVIQIDEVFNNDLVRAATLETVLAAALATFPLHSTTPWSLPPVQSHPAGVRRARLFIEEHPDQALTVQAIAEAAGTSVRALQNGFQRELGMTPTAYLRHVRLHEAHRSLQAGDPTTSTVTEIARSWGFSNTGRFAAEYRALFDQNPAATLRR